MRLAIIIFLLVPHCDSFAAIVNASSTSYADVNDAVNTQAQAGDTVMVPAGSSTWSSTLVIGKAIFLIGAGTNSTIISNNVGTLIQWRPVPDGPIRLSGFRFNSSDSDTEVIQINGPALIARVDHNMFQKSDKTFVCNPVGNGVATGPVYGVADHNYFLNCSRAHFPMNNETTDTEYPEILGGTWGATSWSRAIVAGTTNVMVFEDNTFEVDANFSSAVGDPTPIYGQYGGRLCLRYNLFTGFQGGLIDAHGDGSDYGIVFYEVYNNTFTRGIYGDEGDHFCNQRGGYHIYHDNVFTGTATYVCRLTMDVEGQIHTVTNSFWWGNTWNGGTNQDSPPMLEVYDHPNCTGCSSATIIQDTDFHTHAPESGQYFYPYTPLTYPHPLITAQDGASNPEPVERVRVTGKSLAKGKVQIR